MSNELPPLPAHFAYCYEWVTQTGSVRRSFSDALYNGVGATTSFPLYTESHLREYGRACERTAYERAMEACTITCAKNHADATTFRSVTKAYVAGCDDCHDAIRTLGDDK